MWSTTLLVDDIVVGDSVVVVVDVVVVAAVVVVVVGWGVVEVEVVVVRTGADSGRKCEADALNDLNIDWKFKSDGCDDVGDGATDDGLCVDDSGDGGA